MPGKGLEPLRPRWGHLILSQARISSFATPAARRIARRFPGPKNSFQKEGTSGLTTKAVGIRRQAERGADGRRAVDRLGRALGVGRAVAAGQGAALSLSRSQAPARPRSAAGDPVRTAHGDLVDAPAGRARLRLGGDLLAPPRRVAEGRRVGTAARVAARPLTRCR